MTGETKERWMEFAALAAREQDPKKLIELVRQINEGLDVKFLSLPEQQQERTNNPTSLNNGSPVSPKVSRRALR